MLLALGEANGDVSPNLIGIAAFAFAFLAVGSTYAILGSEKLLRKTTPWLNQLGLHDLDDTILIEKAKEINKRICLLGFSWTASSLLEEITRERSDLLEEIVVIDFNPVVHDKLKKRNIRVVYGDITARDVLHHAGASHAEVIICTLPNMVLKGADNLRILRMVRDLNPHAKIVVHAELLSEVPSLYAAGATYVTTPRLLEAADLLHFIEAAEKELLEEKHDEHITKLEGRNEVIP